MVESPKLRNVNKVIAPFPMNKFPSSFIECFAEEIVYLHATKNPVSIEGPEWEQVFARCVGAEWKPSNVGLDDVVLGNCCWSAKTVKSNRRNLGKLHDVRLISGRNSPVYSYSEDIVSKKTDPNQIGRMVLEIWNERVSAVREVYKFARTVVLVKGENHEEFLIFEANTVRYDSDRYIFSWNVHDNLVGHEKSTGRHCFTWQPHGSQFTIVEDVPKERLHLKITPPKCLEKRKILDAVGYSFNDYWIVALP